MRRNTESTCYLPAFKQYEKALRFIFPAFRRPWLKERPHLHPAGMNHTIVLRFTTDVLNRQLQILRNGALIAHIPRKIDAWFQGFQHFKSECRIDFPVVFDDHCFQSAREASFFSLIVFERATNFQHLRNFSTQGWIIHFLRGATIQRYAKSGGRLINKAGFNRVKCQSVVATRGVIRGGFFLPKCRFRFQRKLFFDVPPCRKFVRLQQTRIETTREKGFALNVLVDILRAENARRSVEIERVAHIRGRGNQGRVVDV